MNEQEKTAKSKTDYLLPFSIIIAALLISGSWIYVSGLKSVVFDEKTADKNDKTAQLVNPDIKNVSEDFSQDHIRGNSEAPVKIVEFSDMECPFCKKFHQTMIQAMDEYGGNNKVAWIYRHYPLEQLHSKAKKSAEASECAAELGGNDGFWDYLDKYFEITPSNDQIDLAELPKIAESVGLNKTQFENCLNSGRYAEKIEAQILDAENSGARGTPYGIVIAENGKKYPIGGALPYEQVKLLIEEALR
ncbi:MAG: thioredoxin domain-containing protein [Patescibacteria group bacterium]